jgi:monofunctional glycosyltransferase
MHVSFPQIASRGAALLRDAARPARILGTFARGLAALAIVGHAALLLFILVASLVLQRCNPPVTALMVWRRITAQTKAQPIRFVPLRQIPRVERTMITRLEDYRFYEHAGVDLGAIRDAWQINASIGRTVVGGSTIPMQLARNLFLTPRKTYFRKYLEAIIAVEMDLLLSKDRILELYLNSIEWGKGIFGIGAAAQYYYRTSVANLGLDEMRRLATIISSPLRFSVQTYYKSAQMRERYAYLVDRFPEPSAEPTDTGKVAPVPDAPEASAEASSAGSTSVDPAGAAAVPDAPSAATDGGAAAGQAPTSEGTGSPQPGVTQ